MLNLTLGYLITTTCDKALIQQKNPAALREKCVYRAALSPLPDQMFPVPLLPAELGMCYHSAFSGKISRITAMCSHLNQT